MSRLSPVQQASLKGSLKGLLTALQVTRDPMLDTALQVWAPTNWDPPRIQGTYGKWVEYRLGDAENRGRVIICYDRENDAIYLVARTAIHDHTSLRELVASFRPQKILQPGSAKPSD